jgi:hypothetical protein
VKLNVDFVVLVQVVKIGVSRSMVRPNTAEEYSLIDGFTMGCQGGALIEEG